MPLKLLRTNATKNKLNNATGANISNLTAKSIFLALKAKVIQLDINKLVNVPNS